MKLFLRKKLSSFMLLFAIVSITNFANADIKRDAQGQPADKDAEIQRATKGYYDYQKNTVSNLEFFTTNYGIFGLDVSTNRGSGFWPRGSRNQYIFGGGVWFGAEKFYQVSPTAPREYRKYCLVTYNPNNARSWMEPGLYNETRNPGNNTKYRAYYSTDFSPITGEPFVKAEGENWPIWDASSNPNDRLRYDRYFGKYILDNADRNRTLYPRGPAFISGEDIFSIYHDNNLNRYDGGNTYRRNLGYPLGLQFEEMIYSWGFGDYKNFIFIKYEIHNVSKDTLYNCWHAAVQDVDIARSPLLATGARNDRVRYIFEEDTLNMASQWTDGNQGEQGFGFGYLGFDFLESPAVIKHYKVDENGDTLRDKDNNPIRENKPDSDFTRKDSAYYVNSSQLGLVTFRNWSIEDDKLEDLDRYNFISAAFTEGDTGPGDKRYLMATGPFHMRPNDTSRIVVGVILANTAKGGEADGSPEDMESLKLLDKFAQTVYDANFRAPSPPDASAFTSWEPLNNGIIVKWNEGSELSTDREEDGLDFLGYKLYRSRNPNLDTFNVDDLTAGAINPITGNVLFNGAGPLGWKEVATWSIPTPFEKSVRLSVDRRDAEYPYLDSLRIVGPDFDASGNIKDTMSIKLMRVGRGITLLDDANNLSINKDLNPTIRGINPEAQQITFTETGVEATIVPWSKYYFDNQNPAIDPNNPQTFIRHDPKKFNYLLDSIFIGRAKFDRALVDYNPLLYKRRTVQISSELYKSLPANGVVRRKRTEDSVAYILKEIPDTNPKKYDTTWGDTIYYKVELPIVDSVFVMNSYKTVKLDNQTTVNVIDLLEWREKSEFMNDSMHVRAVLDTIYSFVKRGLVKLEFPNFEGSDVAKQEVIIPYMNSATNGRTFLDIGDDNRDGLIATNSDPRKTEKIINNVNYYYKIVGFDHGDPNKSTGRKYNNATSGLPNFIEVTPMAKAVSEKVKFEIISEDKNLLGGIYDFELVALDNDRALSLFGGDTLELEFDPRFDAGSLQYTDTKNGNVIKTIPYTMYMSMTSLTNISKGQTLFNRGLTLEQAPCKFNLMSNYLTDNSGTRTGIIDVMDTLIYYTVQDPKDPTKVDTIYQNRIRDDFGTASSRQIFDVSSEFTTGDFTDNANKFCYATSVMSPAYGTLGINFRYALQQYGGVYRPDTNYVISSNAWTNVSPFNVGEVDRAISSTLAYNPVTENFVQQGFNVGPGKYIVEFLPGGTETMNLHSNNFTGGNTDEFTVQYLNIKITNTLEFNKVDSLNNRTVEVKYPQAMEHLNIDPLLTSYNFGTALTRDSLFYPSPLALPYQGKDPNEFIGKFNISAFAIANINPDKEEPNLGAAKYKATKNDPNLILRPSAFSGGQGKYYLSATSARGNKVDFTHILNIAGIPWALDYANFGRAYSSQKMWERKLSPVNNLKVPYGADFAAGDKIALQTFGGVFGQPLPGAKIRVKVSNATPEANLTDEIMDQIQVAPNPYYVSHQGQSSPYAAKLYFTKLPKTCTIDIYTVTGDLIKTLEHNEFTSEGDQTHSLEVWDLITKNGLRAQSQTLVAVIRTPEGAETVKKFSIVVGSFRIID